MPDTPPIAVAVVSYNTRELLASCLESLHPEARAGRAVVWVVDNASTDGSAELVAERFEWVKLIASPDNLGFGRAVNLVAERTLTPWIAPANADIVLEPGALATLLAAGERHREAGVVGPRLVRPDGSTQVSGQPFPTLTNATLDRLRVHRVSPRVAARLCLRPAWERSCGGPVDWLTGAFFIVRREAWDAVGGFDQAQWLYGEDLDLCWRLTRAGWSVRYEPAARVLHVHSAAARTVFKDRLSERMVTASYAWMLRRQGLIRMRATALVRVTDAILRYALLSPLARHSPERWEERRAAAASDLRTHRAGLLPRRALEGFR